MTAKDELDPRDPTDAGIPDESTDRDEATGSAGVNAADEPAQAVGEFALELVEEAQAEGIDSAQPGTVDDQDGVPVVRSADDQDADVETLEATGGGLGEMEITTERVVEAILFASDTPLPLSKIVSILGVGSARDVRNHIQALNEKYQQTNASFRVEQIASGYQMLSLPAYNTWIRRLKQNNHDSRLSQAAMETLAVVAYKQPVVRADIEAIRGVSAGEMLNRLRELGLIKIVGRAEDVGRPMLYGTTKRFLEVFGLSGLEDLPQVEELNSGE